MTELLSFFDSHLDEIREQTIEHLYLTISAMIAATLFGVGLGIMLTRTKRMSSTILGFVGVVQTIPSLAMLGFLLPFLGIGAFPAIVALFLYALLPIVRNTYTGILDIDPAIKEAAIGMGMTSFQLLRFVELPLAFPIILAGIRTSTVINVGIAAICALIAAGGLGDFIFRGITLNNTSMIMAGAIPASILALFIDGYLGFVVRNIKHRIKLLISTLLPLSLVGLLLLNPSNNEKFNTDLKAGFNSEFIERSDGYLGLDSLYGLPIEIKELEIGLMYKALENGQIDVINGFSTDGRIKAYDLFLLEDDKSYFPPYFAAPIVNGQSNRDHPELSAALSLLENRITDSLMTAMNYQVDQLKRPIKEVAAELLNLTLGIRQNSQAGSWDNADILIGSKAFTESYILAHVFAQLIEAKSSLKTNLKLGFGGTKLIFDALHQGDIDIYPEYTGTGFIVILKPSNNEISSMINNEQAVYDYVSLNFETEYDILWLKPLGFNNTFALMMRKETAKRLSLTSISDLSEYLNNTNQ